MGIENDSYNKYSKYDKVDVYDKYDKYNEYDMHGEYNKFNNDDLMTGTVVSFRRSFGWISCDDGSGDAYVHFRDIKGDGFRKLDAGQRVEFILIKQRGGKLKAVQVAKEEEIIMVDMQREEE